MRVYKREYESVQERVRECTSVLISPDTRPETEYSIYGYNVIRLNSTPPVSSDLAISIS